MPTKEYIEYFIRLVDDDFTHPRGWFQEYFPLVIGGFFLVVGNYVWLTYIKNSVPVDTILLAATLVIIADSSAIGWLLTMESGARRRRIRASAHFDWLSKTVPDRLMLMALVRMRANMATGVTLKLLYDSDPSSFSKQKLILRALEPLP